MNAIDILNSHSLKRTSCREGLIEVIMTANQALSENEIRERLSGNYDRTTFYRSFRTLEEHHIIHKIVIDYQTIKYALDTSIIHKKGHAHFFCNECHTVQCLESVTLQKVELPEGYTEEESEIIIKGTCAICKNKIQI